MESASYTDESRETLIARINTLEDEVEKLHLLLVQANKRQFGSKSEKLSASDRQEALFTFDVPAPPIVETVEVDAHKRVVTKGRKPLPDNLRRNRIEYKPEETHCPCCSKELTLFDGEVTEELEYIPAELVVNEHVRLKGVCPGGCRFGVETGELPQTVQPLPRRRPGPGLLAYIIVSKYVDHLPLYRLEQVFFRRGVELRRQRMCDWVHATADEIVKPLWNALRKETLAYSYLQGDETEIKVQDPDVEGKCHKGYFWAAHAVGQKLAFFEYHESRAGACAKDVFEGFKGTLQTDLYAGYNQVILPDTVERIACLAHVRRKFVEAEPAAKPQCTAVLQLIGKLYDYERKWVKESPDKRRELRQKFSKPTLGELEKYLSELSAKTLPQAPLMKAIGYTLGQWREIERIFVSGTFELDNNAIERQIRPIAIGRKNYLFAGSHDGARSAAMFYSLAATCKLNKVNVFDWLKDVIARVPSHPISRIGELLPNRWRPLQKPTETVSTGKSED